MLLETVTYDIIQLFGNIIYEITAVAEPVLGWLLNGEGIKILIDELVLNGGNLDARGVKLMTQLPIEIGYRIAKLFAGRSDSAKAKAEMLGLMVNDPNIKPEELAAIKAPTLVIAGTDDMIKGSHTKLIAANIPGAELSFIKGDHFIAGRNPREFNQKVLEFLQK